MKIPTNGNFINIKGKKYGRLKVLSYAGRLGKLNSIAWNCLCDCGNEKIIIGASLKNGNTKSCGCLDKEKKTTHGMGRTPEYKAFLSSRARCNNKNDKSFVSYGAKGIEFKFNNFEEFFKEIGKRPSKLHSVDRIDNNGNYEKGNIRWATKAEQARNRCNNHYYKINGVSKTIFEWCEIYKAPLSRTTSRVRKRKWDILQALTIPKYGKTREDLSVRT